MSISRSYYGNKHKLICLDKISKNYHVQILNTFHYNLFWLLDGDLTNLYMIYINRK